MGDESEKARVKRLIVARYSGSERVTIRKTSREVLVKNYLSHVLAPSDIRDKTILEIGAGCSQYVPLFLEWGCRAYYANDIIPERLAATRPADPRWIELPGDFLEIKVPEPVDIVFATLIMMFAVPMHDEFLAKIASILKSGGLFMSMDANYLCPLSVVRRFADRRPNPARLFNPFAYRRRVEAQGLRVERMVPFTGPLSWTTGSWLLGTTFWLRARKP